MNKIYSKYLLLLPVYILLQTLIFNQVLFSSYVNPFIYTILILNLPLKISKWFLLIYAFFLGFSVDLFSSILGFHSTATVLMGFFKPLIAKITIPHNILTGTDEIKLEKIGLKSYVSYSLLLIILHNGILFILEHVNFNFDILIKIIMSSLITMVIILIIQLFTKQNK